ncbi:carboxylating nicotinate-nucleotide diphosphorylase [Candidatus Woesearchaeota archaeon]|nr:carboxylating nicotinate-nucleotide diphosphorylase [Candidatus Woesearchaeota archaeon]
MREDEIVKIEATTKKLIDLALAEDIGKGDFTTEAVVSSKKVIVAAIKTREQGVLCGIDVAEEVFKKVDKNLKIKKPFEDGKLLIKGDHVLHIEGKAQSILKASRTALNFLQHLSGVATTARHFTQAAGSVPLLGTRKTTPGFRALEKYALTIGGMQTSRSTLSDGVTLYHYHLKLAEGTPLAVAAAQKLKKPIELEIRHLDELREAMQLPVDVIILSGMSIQEIEEAVKMRNTFNKKIKLRAGGNITLENLSLFTETGIDQISISAATQSAKALDFVLVVKKK